MKKLIKIIIPIIVIVGILYYLFIVGINTEIPVSESELMGKNKEQVLQIALDRAERFSRNNSVRMATLVSLEKKDRLTRKGYYLNSLDEALKDEYINERNIWQLFYTSVPYRIDSLRKYYTIEFKDGKVVDVKECNISEF